MKIIVAAFIVWIGTPIIIIWEWSMWWENGHTFWVFMSVFTGIGWIPAWFMGIFHLIQLNIILAIIYLASTGYYLSKMTSDG